MSDRDKRSRTALGVRGTLLTDTLVGRTVRIKHGHNAGLCGDIVSNGDHTGMGGYVIAIKCGRKERVVWTSSHDIEFID